MVSKCAPRSTALLSFAFAVAVSACGSESESTEASTAPTDAPSTSASTIDDRQHPDDRSSEHPDSDPGHTGEYQPFNDQLDIDRPADDHCASQLDQRHRMWRPDSHRDHADGRTDH